MWLDMHKITRFSNSSIQVHRGHIYGIFYYKSGSPLYIRTVHEKNEENVAYYRKGAPNEHNKTLKKLVIMLMH